MWLNGGVLSLTVKEIQAKQVMDIAVTTKMNH